MKVIDIALKDLLRSFRNAIALVFMFVIPVAVTVLFYFMFGSVAGDNEFNVPKTSVLIVNLDQGSPEFQTSLAGGQSQASSGSALSLGDIIQVMLQSSDFATLLDVSVSSDAASARLSVDKQKAGVAVIIPADFTAAFLDPSQQAVLELYQDPTLTLGPGIVKSILDQLMDNFSGAKIAMGVTMAQAQGADKELAGKVLQQYMTASAAQSHEPGALLETRSPAKAQESSSPLLGVVTQIMGAMMIFYAFYTGTASAQSILQEDENGTLSRLFTTPTTQSTILGGKFLAIGLTVLIQMTTLVVFSILVFGIHWGAPLPVALSVISTVAVSTTMGILINSLLKSTKQGGAVFGGLLTITGMIGMMPVFTQGMTTKPPALEIISLLVPQGWAIRGLFQAVNGESILVSVLVLLAVSVVFFAVGVWKFTKRFA
jgi:ABC-type multidrug transport system permease subunit